MFRFRHDSKTGKGPIMKGNCKNCNKEIRIITNRSTTGMCRDCYQKSPVIKENNKKVARQTKVRTAGFSDLEDFKRQKAITSRH